MPISASEVQWDEKTINPSDVNWDEPKKSSKYGLARTKYDLARAAVHHLSNLGFGTGQLISNAASEGANLVAPNSEVSKYLRDRALSYGDFMKDREAEYRGNVKDTPAAYAGAAFGEVAPFMLKPVQAGIGAVDAAVSGKVGKLVELATKSPALANYLGKIASGATIAPMVTSIQPVVEGPYEEGKLEQLNTAAITGAAIPAIGIPVAGIAKGSYGVLKDSASSLRDTFRNFNPPGQQILADKHIAEFANEGGEQGLRKTLDALDTARNPIGKTTAADAIAGGNMGADSRFGGPLVRLHNELSSLPETTTQLRSLEVGQENARKAALSKISGTSAERDAAIKTVAEAGKAYEAIKSKIVDSNPTLEALSKSPAFQAAEKRAAEISANANAAAIANGEKAIPFKETVNINGKDVVRYSAQGLQHIKQVMDEMTNSPTLRSQLGISGTESANIAPVKNTLTSWMEKNIEGWKSARNAYKAAKVVTDRQKAGDVLSTVLTGPRGEERVGQFLKAKENLPKTLKPALGKERAVEFTADEQKILNDVTKELQNEAMYSRMVQETNIPGATNPVTGKMANLPSPLYRPTMIANWLLRSGGESGNKAVNKIAAEILSDPAKAAEVIRKHPPEQRGKIMAAISDFNRFAEIYYKTVVPSVTARELNK